jgi:Arc/MetJ-type ribon-helix-helix transcriptional regulator
MPTVATWIPKALVRRLEARLKGSNFLNKSEYLRDLIRRDLEAAGDVVNEANRNQTTPAERLGAEAGS